MRGGEIQFRADRNDAVRVDRLVTGAVVLADVIEVTGSKTSGFTKLAIVALKSPSQRHGVTRDETLRYTLRDNSSRSAYLIDELNHQQAVNQMPHV